ncbi:MAG: hypothetical protein JXR07_01510 [Reichenbachiella sp.]
MRLASLARKIKITPSKLSEFLIDQKIDLTQGSNTKLTDAQVAQTLLHFGKELPSEKTTETEPPSVEVVEIENDTAEAVEELEPIEDTIDPKEEIEETSEAKKNQIKDLNVPDEETVVDDSKIVSVIEESIEEEEEEEEGNLLKEDESVTIVDPSYLNKRHEDDDELGLTEKAALDENVKIIKPPKVKLQGLTVKGKIELPEPKVKIEVEKEEINEEEKPIDPDKIIYTSGPQRDRTRKPKKHNKRKRDSNFNPLEEERKRKANKEKREEERRLKALKAAKAKHYKTTVVQKKQTAKKINKPKELAKTVNSVSRQKPSPTNNPLKRFWRWMNT